MTPKTKDNVEQDEAGQARRRDEALRRALAMPPKRHKGERKPPKSRSDEARPQENKKPPHSDA